MTASAETFTDVKVGTDRRSSAVPLNANENGTAAPTGAAVPVRAEGVQLLGAVGGSGYRRAPSLVRRSDGQTIQLTPLLYDLLDAIDGERDYGELAEILSRRSGKHAAPDDVHFLIETKLRPLGVLEQPDGSQPRVRKANPLLGLRLKLVVSNPAITSIIAAPFTILFRLPVVLAMMVAFTASIWWIVFEQGLASAAHEALYEPQLLVLAFALMLLSTAFHEIGHAAACRFGGAKPGAMGVGLYLVWPAFYTDVTDSYRLDRGARLRVDLGGLYFNAIFGVAMVALWALLRWDALLLVVVAQLVQMVRQLTPIIRFDGYHVLADLVGVPDLFQHIKPTLLGLLPFRRRGRARNPLKLWARAVVTLWVLLVVPLLAALLVFMVLVYPRIIATAWDSLGLQGNAFQANWDQGNVYALIQGVLAMFTIALPVFGIAYLLVRLARSSSRKVWRGTAGRPVLRSGAVLAGVVVLSAVAWAWWPNDQYRPIEPNEGVGVYGTIPSFEAVQGVLTSFEAPAPESAAPAPPSAPAEGHWELVALPQLSPSQPGEDGWIFPWDHPREPHEGDNQALAINTEDGATVVDVALALEWVTDGGPVDQWNDAWALASCTGCTTTAVAFQTLIVVGYAQIITPVNAAVAANYACRGCRTQALALQLVATLADMPDEVALGNLAQVWSQLEEMSENFVLMPLEEIYSTLVAAETAILEILEPYQAVSSTSATSVTADGAATQPQTTTSSETQTTTSEAPAPEEPAGTTTTTTTTTAAETTTTTTAEETPSAPSEAPSPSEPAPTTTTGQTEPNPPPPPP